MTAAVVAGVAAVEAAAEAAEAAAAAAPPRRLMVEKSRGGGWAGGPAFLRDPSGGCRCQPSAAATPSAPRPVPAADRASR
eukprot:1083558-Pyramimonas_sp.AAC.1